MSKRQVRVSQEFIVKHFEKLQNKEASLVFINGVVYTVKILGWQHDPPRIKCMVNHREITFDLWQIQEIIVDQSA